MVTRGFAEGFRRLAEDIRSSLMRCNFNDMRKSQQPMRARVGARTNPYDYYKLMFAVT